MAAMTFNLIDERTGLNVEITATENTDGSLTFDLEVLDSTGVIGDLNGLFFDVLDDSLVDGLTVTGADVTKVNLNADSVTKVDGYNNINGDVKNEYGKFDAGVQFGTQGMAKDDIQSTSFTLSHSDATLTLDQFFSQDFAVRLTSVGAEDGSRDDSLKIGGTAADEPIAEDPVNLANNDSLFLANTETFSAAGLPDELDDGFATILDNDTTDEFEYSGLVVEANGDAFVGQAEVAGSLGGLLRINDDGTVDFSANGDFDDLDEASTIKTEFTYAIEGGSTATIIVEVFAVTDEQIDDEGVNDEGTGGDEVFDDGFVDEPFSDFG